MDTLLKIRNMQIPTFKYSVIKSSVMEINDVNLIKKEILKKNTGISNFIVAHAYMYIENDEFAYEFFLKEGAKKNHLDSIRHLIYFYNEKKFDEKEEKYGKLYNKLQSD